MEEKFIWKSPNKKWEISTFDGEFRVYDNTNDKWYRVIFSDEVNPMELKQFPLYVRVELAFFFASPPPSIMVEIEQPKNAFEIAGELELTTSIAEIAASSSNNINKIVVTERIREIAHIRCCHVEKGIHHWGTIVGGYTGYVNDKMFYAAYHIIFDNGKRTTMKANTIHIPKKGRDKL